jgi:aminoglycoside 3-N-acetyltransferase
VKTTRRRLLGDLSALGVRPGDLLMVHAGVRSVGDIVGGVNTLIQALLDAVGAEGTLSAYVDFEPFFDEEDDPADIPVFDKLIAPAARDHGILHEAMRNWPGAHRSDHPDAGVVAIGRVAQWITVQHPFHYGYGEGTPFEKIVQAEGRVLMIGAPLDTITMLHYAEHMADLPGKRIVRYRRLMPGVNGPTWIDFEEYDTSEPAHPAMPTDCFEQIARDYLAAGHGRTGKVGSAASYLFEAPGLVRFGIEWLERYVNSGQEPPL